MHKKLEGLDNDVNVRDCFEVGQKMSTYCRELLKIVSPNFEVVVDLATDGCGEVCGRGGLGVHRTCVATRAVTASRVEDCRITRATRRGR